MRWCGVVAQAQTIKAMTPEPTQEQTIAAFKERLRQKVNAEITEAEAEAELGRGKPGEQFWRGRLNALRTTLLLLDETH